MRTASLCVLAAALAAGGCTTVKTMRARLVRAPSACVDQTVQVYFEPGSADLTPEGRAVIDAEARTARRCRVKAAEVLGLSDAIGPADANYELSRRRAGSVSAALAANGLPAADFRVGAAGQAGAITPDGTMAPLRRRVDVTLRLAPR
jgi:outer membrane protein OmpA-like peptidoglycan-associated protein